MIKNKDVETREQSSVKLTVTLDKKAVKQKYDELIQKYLKTAHIKGFRKGKVPISVLERKFGESLKAEASMNAIEDGLKKVFEEIEEKPLPYNTPELQEELDFDFDKDLTFTVVYDVFPAIKLGAYKELEIEQPSASITKEDEERELKTLQNQNAVIVEKKNGSAEQNDIVTVNYEEIGDDGKVVPGTRREEFVFTIGTGNNLYKIDDDVLGMKKDEEREIEKEYPEDYEVPELKGRKVKLKVKMTALKQKQLPDLDDELAQDVSEKYNTLEDLKKDLRAKMKEAVEQKIREKTIEKIMDQIIENSPIDLPVSMVEAELAGSWKNFVAQFRTEEQNVIRLLEEQGRSKEQVMEEWKPGAERKIKTRLLMDKIIDTEKPEITDNEIEKEIERQAEVNNVPLDDAKKRFENKHMRESLKSGLEDKKLFDFLIEQANIKKGKKVKFLDLMQDNQ